MTPAVELSGSGQGEAREGECSLDEVFPFGDIQVLGESEEVKRMNICSCQSLATPDELVVGSDGVGCVLYPGTE